MTTFSKSGEADRRLEAVSVVSTALREFLDRPAEQVVAGEYDCARFDIPAASRPCPPTRGLRLRATVGDVDIAAGQAVVAAGDVRARGDGRTAWND